MSVGQAVGVAIVTCRPVRIINCIEVTDNPSFNRDVHLLSIIEASPQQGAAYMCVLHMECKRKAMSTPSLPPSHNKLCDLSLIGPEASDPGCSPTPPLLTRGLRHTCIGSLHRANSKPGHVCFKCNMNTSGSQHTAILTELCSDCFEFPLTSTSLPLVRIGQISQRGGCTKSVTVIRQALPA